MLNLLMLLSPLMMASSMVSSQSLAPPVEPGDPRDLIIFQTSFSQENKFVDIGETFEKNTNLVKK
jgi:hypothetical protein